jgi:glutamine amidotransferase
MSATVAIVDYGAGNLLSVERALRHLGAEATLAATPAQVAGAERLVLPGVGAFAACMAGLVRSGLDAAVHRFAASGRPFLGICVGLQMMFEGSDEFGATPGLGLFAGWVRAIPPESGGRRRKIPHVGWNALRPANADGWNGGLLAGIAPGESVYFVHSFAAEPARESDSLAVCDYEGTRVLAAARRDNLHGCQFHPEKSGPVGLAILRNFLALSSPCPSRPG